MMCVHCNTPNDVEYVECHNPSLGLTTKARACKVASQEGSPRVMLHASGSVGKCEGMNPHTFKGTSTLRVGVSVIPKFSKSDYRGQNSMD